MTSAQYISILVIANVLMEVCMSKYKKLAAVREDCVACGCCAGVCPRDAISLSDGIRAKVDQARCVGCGKCESACPGGIISMRDREERCHEKTVV